MNSLADVDAPLSNEFNQHDYQSVFDAFYGECNGGQHHEDCHEASTFWEVLFTNYLPVIFLWIRRGMFGITMIVRTLILGHLLRLLCGNLSEWVHEKIPAWAPAFLHPLAGGNHHNAKLVDNSWPPPALTGLALLTIFALVVHPDGLTWIMLRNVRNGIFSVLHTMSSCWQILLTDYGVIPTIIASMTLATLIFILFAMLRTITPKRSSRRRYSPTPKKKKKRKGQTRQRGNPAKSKGAQGTSSSLSSSSSPSPNSTTIVEDSNPSQNMLPDTEALVESNLSGGSAGSDGSEEKARNSVEFAESHAVEAKHEPASVPESPMKPAALSDDMRDRITSVSTLDTTPLSDDHSCGSTSTRSYPSVSVASSKTCLVAPVEEEPILQKVESPISTDLCQATTGMDSGQKGSTTENKHRNYSPKRPDISKQQQGKPSKGKNYNRKNNEGHSRWDALRPNNAKVANVNHLERGTQNTETNARQSNPVGIGNRQSNRRGGRGHQVQQNRRGRNSNHSNCSPTRKSPTRNSPIRKDHHASHGSQGPRNTNRQPKGQRNQKNGPRTNFRSPKSPPSLSRQGDGLRVSTNAPTMPLPPPGLSLVSANAPSFVPETPLLLGTPQRRNESSLPLLSAVSTGSQSARTWDMPKTQDQAYVSPSFFQGSSTATSEHDWTQPSAFDSPPRNFATSPQFATTSQSTATMMGTNLEFSGNRVVKENPFAPEASNNHNSKNNREFDKQIEAELKELGGQMAGSILDF